MKTEYQIIKEFISKYLEPKDEYKDTPIHDFSMALLEELTEETKQKGFSSNETFSRSPFKVTE